MASDTRTNAGVDDIAAFKKMYLWEFPGDRVIVLLAAGNLSVTQSVVSRLEEQIAAGPGPAEHDTLISATSMFQVARIVGRTLRDTRFATAAGAHAEDRKCFGVTLLLGGQIKGGKLGLYQIYDAGNFIEATEDTPYFQIGEHKYGKPILDRVTDVAMPLANAAKLILVSFDSTIRSNLTVGMPIDLLIYRRNALEVELTHRIAADDAYFCDLTKRWSDALRMAFVDLPGYTWDSAKPQNETGAPGEIKPPDGNPAVRA